MTPASPAMPANPGPIGTNAALGDVALPAMLVKDAALENNLAVMKKYAADHGFLLAPHGKTTMAPKIFRRQLEAGAWAITVANMTQAAVAYQAGSAACPSGERGRQPGGQPGRRRGSGQPVRAA